MSQKDLHAFNGAKLARDLVHDLLYEAERLDGLTPERVARLKEIRAEANRIAHHMHRSREQSEQANDLLRELAAEIRQDPRVTQPSWAAFTPQAAAEAV